MTRKASGKPTGGRALVPQPHGGALLPGAGGGAESGRQGGRPASAIRRQLRGDFDERTKILREIADGIVTVQLRQVCEHCGKEPTAPIDDDDDVLKRSPTAADRMKALEMMARIGFGPPLSVTEAWDKINAIVAGIEQRCDQKLADELISMIRAVWYGR